MPSQYPNTNFGEPPPGYIPGIGRGAVGFSTQAEYGPAIADAKTNRAQGFINGGQQVQDEQAAFQARSTASTNEEKEAEVVFNAIEERMSSQRTKSREQRLKEAMKTYRKSRPQIAEQFKGLKRKLGDLNEKEWESIPDSLDYSRQNALRQQEKKAKFVPVPDMAFSGVAALQEGQSHATLSAEQQGLTVDSTAELTRVGKARAGMLGLELDRRADSVSGQTTVNPTAYLSEIDQSRTGMASGAQVGDLKKARQLLKSVTNTNPSHGPGWIAAARFEKEAGKMREARRLIMEGCDAAGHSENVWVEAVRLHDPQEAKRILVQAVRHLPTSVTLWLEGVALESDPAKKKAVVRKALELVPKSVKLWKVAVEMEDPENARKLLQQAVKLCPGSTDLWLALAKLSPFQQAQAVLNEARKALPQEPLIWIAAGQLMEANTQDQASVTKLFHNALKLLQHAQVSITRDIWLNEAQRMERSGSPMTCRAIVSATLHQGIDAQDRKATWLADAERFVEQGNLETARAVFDELVAAFPTSASLWSRFLAVEKQLGSAESYRATIDRALESCPDEEVFWMMNAKERWLAGDLKGARDILRRAMTALPDDEDIWLAAVKLEAENKEFERARILAAEARKRAGTARVWMKSALLERKLGNDEEEGKLLQEALGKFETAPKLWLMQAQHYERKGELDEARKVYRRGTKRCPAFVALWLCYARLERRVGNVADARNVLQNARLKSKSPELLWLESIRVEWQANMKDMAEKMQAKALLECKESGQLWAQAIGTDTRHQRKTRGMSALDKTSDDPFVFLALAKLFWADNKIKKTREWMNRAIAVGADNGDIWAHYLKFELTNNNGDAAEDLVQRCIDADPTYGELWCSVRKDDANCGKSTKDILILCASRVDPQQLFKEHAIQIPEV